MAIDIKAKIKEVTDKVQGDKDIAAKFEKDPVKTVEGIIGMDLPDDQINGIIAGVKAKLGDAGAVSGILNKAKGLFG